MASILISMVIVDASGPYTSRNASSNLYRSSIVPSVDTGGVDTAAKVSAGTRTAALYRIRVTDFKNSNIYERAKDGRLVRTLHVERQ